MQSKQIKPLLFSHIEIFDKIDVQLILKKRQKFAQTFLYYQDTYNMDEYSFIKPLCCLKVSKHIKLVQEFMLDSCCEADLHWRRNKRYFFRLAKNISKVKTIYFEKSLMTTESLAEWFIMCLKCSRHLKRIDTDDGIKEWNDTENKAKFEYLSKLFLKGRLQSLNIYGGQPDLLAGSVHHFSKINCFTYTSRDYAEEFTCNSDELRKVWFKGGYEGNLCGRKFRSMDFAFCWEYHNQASQMSYQLLQNITKSWILDEIAPPKKRCSITDMTNLAALQIDFPIDSELFIYLLESLPDLSNLRSLKIDRSFSAKFQDFELCSQLLNIARNLTTLNLNLERAETPLKYLANFPKDLPLRKLDLKLQIMTESGVDSIISLISCLKGTQILSLEISAPDVSLFHPKLYLLTKQIFDLKDLIKVELTWMSWDTETQNYNEKHLSFAFSSLLDRFLTKQPRVEALKIHFVLLNPSERYSSLTNVIQKGQRLKELDINVGGLIFDKTDFGQIVSTLKNLKEIEILRLEGFSITQKTEFSTLVQELCYLPKLRELTLGKVMKTSFEFLAKMINSLFSSFHLKQINLFVSSEIIDLIVENSERIQNDIKDFGTALRSRTSESIEWQKGYYDIYFNRRGRGTGRGRYTVRGADRSRRSISWFEGH